MCQFTIGRWLSVRLQSLGAVTLFFTALFVAVFPELLDAGLAGLVINYSMMATGTLQGFIENFTELELKMNGIERVKYYTEVATEKPYEKDSTAALNDAARKVVEAPKSWPQLGAVVFDRVCARYRPGLDMVLNDVSFDVKSGEKVRVLDAVCFVYTCRRLIDLSLSLLCIYMPAIDRSLSDCRSGSAAARARASRA